MNGAYGPRCERGRSYTVRGGRAHKQATLLRFYGFNSLAIRPLGIWPLLYCHCLSSRKSRDWPQGAGVIYLKSLAVWI